MVVQLSQEKKDGKVWPLKNRRQKGVVLSIEGEVGGKCRVDRRPVGWIENKLSTK